MSREMKDSGIEWIGEIPKEWKLVSTKRLFSCKKQIVGNNADDYDRLALTMQGVIKRDKEDNEGLQPEKFDGYQILKKNEIVFKLIDLANVKTSRVGLSPYLGIVSPAYIIIRNNSKDNRYFYYWFMFMYHHNIFNQMGDDGVRSSLNADDVLKIPIANISLSEQQQIANYLDKVCGEVDDLVALQEQMIEELKAYKQSVITEAVTKGLNPNVPMKDSGIDWIGEVPEGWKIGRLKRISNKIGDGLHGTPEYVDNSPYYFINGNNLGRKQIEIYNDTNKVNKAEYDIYYIDLDDNTILISLNGTIGNLSFYNGEKVILGKSAGYVRLMSQSNKHYYYYYLQALNVKEYFYLSLAGTTIGNLSLGTLRNTPITIPPLSEQQSIASYLDEKCSEIDSLIAIKQAKIVELKEYKKSVIYEYVTGKKEIA